jgi:hypothetical protein
MMRFSYHDISLMLATPIAWLFFFSLFIFFDPHYWYYCFSLISSISLSFHWYFRRHIDIFAIIIHFIHTLLRWLLIAIIIFSHYDFTPADTHTDDSQPHADASR